MHEDEARDRDRRAVSAGERMRELLEAPEILVLPGVYDCLGARIVELAGFPVVFTSGFGFSASLLGKPDYGFLTATEVLEAVRRIASAVSIPVVADLDTGYGNALNVHRTVTEAVQAGIGGVILEDQLWPKKCGHFEGKRVVSLEEHAEKIRAAVDARGDSGLVIIARTDARAVLGLEEALRRGQACLEAGADVIFVEAPQSVEELHEINRSFPDTHTFANMIEGGKTPLLSASELESIGFKIVVFPLAGLFAATEAQQRVFRYLREKGSTAGLDVKLDFGEFEEVIEVEKYRRLESRYRSDG